MAYTNRFPTGSNEYQPADSARSRLAASISTNSISIQLSDISSSDVYANFPTGAGGTEAPFIITIDNEQILIYSRSGDILTVWQYDTHGAYSTITGAGETGRGYADTSAATHTIITTIDVLLNVTEEHIEQIQDAIALLETNKSEDSDVVHLTGAESVGGVKTFDDDGAETTTNAAPGSEKKLVNQKYVTDNLTAALSAIKLSAQTIDGGAAVKDPVYYSGGTWYQADEHHPPQGVLTAAAEVTLKGYKSGLTGLTAGGVYMNKTGGGLQIEFNQIRIGKALSATELIVDIEVISNLPSRDFLLLEYGFEEDNAKDTGNFPTKVDVTMVNDTYQEGINEGRELIINGINTAGESNAFDLLSRQKISISLWLTADDPTHGTDDLYVIGYCLAGNERSGWQLSVSNSLLWFRAFGISGAEIGTRLEVAYTSTARHHVAITCDDTTYKMYVDGVEVDSKIQPTFEFNAMEIQIGKRDAKITTMAGALDLIRIYKKCLNPEEVRALANEDNL